MPLAILLRNILLTIYSDGFINRTNLSALPGKKGSVGLSMHDNILEQKHNEPKGVHDLAAIFCLCNHIGFFVCVTTSGLANPCRR